MNERPVRLGDVVDDYCPRCKLNLDHAVQALEGESIQTVVCKTCMHGHSFRKGKSARKSKAKPSLFDQILAKKPPAPVMMMPTTKRPASHDGGSTADGGEAGTSGNPGGSGEPGQEEE